MSKTNITFKNVEDKIVILRDIRVILDADVAELYGVETKEINQAVKNNPEKFPEGYVLVTTKAEKEEVVKNFDHLGNDMKTTDTETEFELNFAVLKLKHTVKRKK